MGSLLTSAIFNCDEFEIGGIQRLFITNRELITNFYYNTSDLHRSTVASFFPYTGVTWFEFIINPSVTNASESLNISLNGKSYQHKFQTEFIGLTVAKRDTLEELINNDNLLLIYQDYNNLWWILGEDKGMKVASYEMVTGAKGGDEIKYSIELENSTKYRIRAVDSSFVNQYILPYYSVVAGGCITCYQFLSPYTLQSNATIPLVCILTCPLQ